MKAIIKILLLLFPIPFVFSYYIPLESIYSVAYVLKHGLILLILVSTLMFHFPFKRLMKFKLYFFSSFLIFISYLFFNFLFKSDFKYIHLFYILSYIILFLFAFSISRISDSIRLLKYPYYSLVILLSGTILYSLANNINVYSEWNTLDHGITKIRYTFGYFHPGYFASFLMVCGILSHLLIRQKLIGKWNYLITILSFILIYLSQTRNCIISFCIYLLISHSEKSFKFFKIISFTSFLLLIILLRTNWQYLNVISSGRFSTWITHYIYNYNSFNLLFGTGIGNAQRIEFKSNYNSVSENDMVFHVDNFYFEILLQFGAIGILLLIIVILMLFQTIKKSEFKGYNKRVLIAILFTLSFFAFFDSSFISTGNIVSVLLWTMFFVQLNMNYMKKII